MFGDEVESFPSTSSAAEQQNRQRNSSISCSFLFGNVDPAGNLEEDFFDEETKAQLGNLNCIFGKEDTFIIDTTDGSELQPSSAHETDDFLGLPVEDRAPTCEKQDFYDTQELLEVDSDDDGEFFGHQSGDSDGSDSNSDDDDMNEITPLAAMLPEDYRNIDARIYFPEFKKGKVLRFSRLFRKGRPGSYPQIWKGSKSKKIIAQQPLEEPKDSQTEADEKPPFQLEFAPTPPPEECQTDDEV